MNLMNKMIISCIPFLPKSIVQIFSAGYLISAVTFLFIGTTFNPHMSKWIGCYVTHPE